MMWQIKGTITLGSPPWQGSWPTSPHWRWPSSSCWSYYDDIHMIFDDDWKVILLISWVKFTTTGPQKPEPARPERKVSESSEEEVNFLAPMISWESFWIIHQSEHYDLVFRWQSLRSQMQRMLWTQLRLSALGSDWCPFQRNPKVTATTIPKSNSIWGLVVCTLNLAGPLLHGGSTPGSLIAPCLRLTRTLETNPRACLCIDTSSR